MSSNDHSNPLDAPSTDWLDPPVNPLEENSLADAFYLLLDDVALREVFDDLLVPGKMTD
jgi:hypothetical protein